MSRTLASLVIDARPRGPSGPLAGEIVLGRTVIDHLCESAEVIDRGASMIVIHAREDEHERIRSLVAARPSNRFRVAFGPPPEDAVILRTDRMYDAGRLERAVKLGRDPESAVIWRLDRPHALAGADDEMTRRRTYQPLGRFWAARPALWVARRLAPTSVRPNGVTLCSGGLMLGAAALLAVDSDNLSIRLTTAVLIAISLILDTADGHLARLQGTASEFGRWLDANLDELGDLTLHGAAAWSAYSRSGFTGWLMLGMLYMLSKYMFLFGTQAPPSPTHANPTIESKPGPVRSLVHLLGHADIRLHLWILSSACGRMDVSLVAYAIYFLARSTGGAVRKAGAYAS